jgi:transcriptional regulator with XRE-family HTH domain
LDPIAARVREARTNAGISQEELGRRLGLTRAGYGHYESGRQPFTVDHLFQLSRILNRSVEYFLGLDTGRSAEEDQVVTLYKRLAAAGLGGYVVSVLEAAVKGLIKSEE